MRKYKCPQSGCDHKSHDEGYCPKHGEKLIVRKDYNKSDNDVENLLSKIGDIVKTTVKSEMKNYQPKDKNIHAKAMPNTKAEKLEYVKSILNDKDEASFINASSDEAKVKFLHKARAAYFFKHLIRYKINSDPAELEHVKALAEGTDADGGYLTPTEFRAQLVEDLQDEGFLRGLVTVIPMTSDSLELPTLLSSVKTSWGSENTAISTTTARFGTLTFTPYRLNTFIYSSRELVNDAAINVVQTLTRLMREAIGREEDRVIIRGSGSGQPKGILQETLLGIDNENNDSNLAANIKKLPFKLAKAYRRNAIWLINKEAFGSIAALKDDNGQFLFKEGIEGKTPHRLAGYTVEEQNDMSIDELLFGDLKQYFLGDREQLSVETTTEGAGTFEKHQIAIKVVERIDGKVAQTLGFRKLSNAGID